MRSLFLKIFLSYWMALALFLVLAILATLAMRPAENSSLHAQQKGQINEFADVPLEDAGILRPMRSQGLKNFLTRFILKKARERLRIAVETLGKRFDISYPEIRSLHVDDLPGALSKGGPRLRLLGPRPQPVQFDPPRADRNPKAFVRVAVQNV